VLLDRSRQQEDRRAFRGELRHSGPGDLLQVHDSLARLGHTGGLPSSLRPRLGNWIK